MTEGDCFLGAYRRGDTKHLWVILTDPNDNGEHVVMVNVTTLGPDSEKSCVLQPGDHPFIKHLSVINYQDGVLCKVENIREALGKLGRDFLEQREKFDPAVLKRIKAGALQSPSFKRKYKQLIRI